MTFFSSLECSSCRKLFNPALVRTFCPDCQAPLLAVYDLVQARSVLDRTEFRNRDIGMWRWHEMLPVQKLDNIVCLGEGDTPLLSMPRLGAACGLQNLFIKDESLNPTGTFKARGLAVAVSKAKELGISKIVIPTAGNAGGALAAYAARAGLAALIIMPQDTPKANIDECRITGASIILVNGLISDAAVMAGEKVRSEGWFDVSTFKEPYRVEGKKVMGYELAEAFNWVLPDVIIYPTGGGTGLVGMWKSFNEMEALGWLDGDHKPRMVAVQAEGCAPVIKAFHSGADHCDFWKDAQTIASGLRVPKSFADRLILNVLRDSYGNAVSVSDEEILDAQKTIAISEGIFAAPEGAATYAGLTRLIDQGWVKPEEKIVLFNTGTGLKYLK